jgi:hypothetical protein
MARTRRFFELEIPKDVGLFADLPPPDPSKLGPLRNLLGAWEAKGTGWNMIALPFVDRNVNPPVNTFRILMNQYDERLTFDFVDDDVPNRGLLRKDRTDGKSDQLIATLDYQQAIKQVAATDFPSSGPAEDLVGPVGLPIHHEPGLWMFHDDFVSKDDVFPDGKDEVELKVARLASIPHGNSLLALGTAQPDLPGMPPIPKLNALPSGRFSDVRDGAEDVNVDAYLAPYQHFVNSPFMGNVPGGSTFPGFNPADMNEILRFANQGVNIVRTTVLSVDTTRKNAGIRNIPFSVREAEPVSMRSTFWIQELAEHVEGRPDQPKLRLQYSQVVMLNFFHPRQDELPERAAWPHVSIATLEKTFYPDPVDDLPKI